MKWITKGINLIKSIGWNILIPAPKDEALNKLDPEAEYIVEIKKKIKRRSLNANAYAWVLCDKIARELSKNAYISKNDVYKRVLIESGTFTYLQSVCLTGCTHQLMHQSNVAFHLLCKRCCHDRRERLYNLPF